MIDKRNKPKFIDLGKNNIRVIDTNYDFITSKSWLVHLDTLSAIDLLKGIQHMKSVINHRKKTVDHDLSYENHLLITFSWKLKYKRQLTLF